MTYVGLCAEKGNNVRQSHNLWRGKGDLMATYIALNVVLVTAVVAVILGLLGWSIAADQLHHQNARYA